MSEPEYYDINVPLMGYDEDMISCFIRQFRNRNNPNDMRYETTDGEKAIKISENQFRLPSGRVITVS